jgi:hypothetical protein
VLVISKHAVEFRETSTCFDTASWSRFGDGWHCTYR